jgi:hypothetical protein
MHCLHLQGRKVDQNRSSKKQTEQNTGLLIVTAMRTSNPAQFSCMGGGNPVFEAFFCFLFLAGCLDCSSVLRMEAINSSETPVNLYWTTRLCVPELWLFTAVRTSHPLDRELTAKRVIVFSPRVNMHAKRGFPTSYCTLDWIIHGQGAHHLPHVTYTSCVKLWSATGHRTYCSW